MTGNKALIDVLVMLPEYSERSVLIDSALEMVRSINNGIFKFTYTDFPEEDPRLSDLNDISSADDKVISHNAFLRAATNEDHPDRGFHTHFDFVEDQASFNEKIRSIQDWLEFESEEYWFEMDRPDFRFSPNRTVGIYLNPNPNNQDLVFGQLAEHKNVFFIHLSALKESHLDIHIQLAKLLWLCAFKFSMLLYQEFLSKIYVEPADNTHHNRSQLLKLKALLKNDSSETAQDIRFVLNEFEKGLVQLEALQKGFANAYNTIDSKPLTYNPRSKNLELKELGIYIRLNLKERMIYQFFLSHDKGLSLSEFAEYRGVFMDMYLNENASNQELDRAAASKIVDQLIKEEGLRIVVSSINKKLGAFDFIPMIKSSSIIKVGDRFTMGTPAVLR